MGEDIGSKFDDAYLIESYIENVDGFEGSGDLYNKFGLEIRDEATFIVSRRQWNNLVGFWNNSLEDPKPQEGDLLFLPMSNSFFEIMFVEDEQPFYQLSNLPVFKMQCSLFEYNDEQFETGVSEIDAKEITNAQQTQIDLTVTGGNHFTQGEIVTQVISTDPAVSVYGEVQTVTKTTDIAGSITVSGIGVTGTTEAKDFFVSTTVGLTGSESTNTCFITKVHGVTDSTSFPVDEQAMNYEFEVAGDNFIDFTESNPFGDPSETY